MSGCLQPTGTRCWSAWSTARPASPPCGAAPLTAWTPCWRALARPTALACCAGWRRSPRGTPQWAAWAAGGWRASLTPWPCSPSCLTCRPRPSSLSSLPASTAARTTPRRPWPSPPRRALTLRCWPAGCPRRASRPSRGGMTSLPAALAWRPGSRRRRARALLLCVGRGVVCARCGEPRLPRPAACTVAPGARRSHTHTPHTQCPPPPPPPHSPPPPPPPHTHCAAQDEQQQQRPAPLLHCL